MKSSELVKRVRAGEAVVLGESPLAFLARTLGPALLVLISGILLGALKGGFWWGLAAFGGVALLLMLLWAALRTAPQLTVKLEGVVFAGQGFKWCAIETFGAGSAEFMPDWISLKTSDGNIVSFGSTFGWKKEILRDALNELEKELNTTSARAQFEATRETVEGDAEERSSQRFQRPTGPDDAMRQARQILSTYYHADCDTVTEVSERVLRIAALDPHAFPPYETDCAGCGRAPMKEVTLTNGQTLHEAFTDMQKLTPVKAQLGKFFLFSAILAPAGLVVGLSIPVAKNGWLLGFLGGGLSFLIGIICSMVLYRPLRKAGFLW